MSSEHVMLRAEGVGKRYRIGAREPYKALRDVIADAFTAPLRRARSGPTDARRAHLGPRGHLVRRPAGRGARLIGANGAGKSTLLKVLSRITEPTEGQVTIRGRVGSLLEVGTGFHPELTGRENIFLNGTILGMRNAEIRRRFDEIVEFAGMAQFLDTPVKRYSSGMQVRLAFAVAAHLEPEILLVDEVLAVGDAEFQQKCLGKMRDVTQEGRTVVFVSHNLGAVRSLCSRALVLEKGRLVYDGDTSTGSSATSARVWATGPGSSRARSCSRASPSAGSTARRPSSSAAGSRCSTRRARRRPRSTPTRRSRSPSTTSASSPRASSACSSCSATRKGRRSSARRASTTARRERAGLEPGVYRSSVTIPANLFGGVELAVSVSLVSEVMQVLDFVRACSSSGASSRG